VDESEGLELIGELGHRGLGDREPPGELVGAGH
jgi:hypothetical protein